MVATPSPLVEEGWGGEEEQVSSPPPQGGREKREVILSQIRIEKSVRFDRSYRLSF